MKITAMKNLNGDGDEYLDVSTLADGVTYEKVALVVDATPGVTKMMSGFAKFYLKDVNANVIRAVLFDVKDFVFSGLKMSAFKNKPVKLRFAVQEWGGSLSLIIDGSFGIEEYSGDFDYSRFVGSIDFDREFLNQFYSRFDDVVPEDLHFMTDSTLGQGRTGALGKIMESVVVTLSSYSGLLGDSFGSLMHVCHKGLIAEYRLSKLRQRESVFSDAKVFELFTSLNNLYLEDPYYLQVHDLMRCIFEYGKPKHLFSHLFLKAFDNAVSSLNLLLLNNGLVVGSSLSLGGVELSKF